jgi:hypothetical protein
MRKHLQCARLPSWVLIPVICIGLLHIAGDAPVHSSSVDASVDWTTDDFYSAADRARSRLSLKLRESAQPHVPVLGQCGDVVMTQSADPKFIAPLNTVQCGVSGSHTGENGLARSFPIEADLKVCSVQFGIGINNAVGPWPVEVRLLEGDITGLYGDLELRAASSIVIPPDIEAELFSVSFDPPAEFFAGENLIVELYIATRNPANGGDGGETWIGSNNLGQTAPSYVRAPGCNTPNFLNYASLGAAHVHLVMKVFATYVVNVPTLEIVIPEGTHPLEVGEEFFVHLRMRDLEGTQAAGFQAFLEYDPEQMTFEKGVYLDEPFGQHIITPIESVDNAIDIASGVDIHNGQFPTSDDATLVTLHFTANQTGCVRSLRFREHSPPTRISDETGSEIQPLQLISLPPDQPSSDLNGDGVVDGADLLTMLSQWGDCADSILCTADLNCDGSVDGADLLILLSNWG